MIFSAKFWNARWQEREQTIFGGIENYDSIGEFIKDIGIADEIIKIEIAKAVEAGANNKATIQIVNKEEYYDSKIDAAQLAVCSVFFMTIHLRLCR